VVALAIESGIPTDVWWSGDPRELATALQLLGNERKRQARQQLDGRVTSG
jgi:hypothetical protein